MLKSLLLIFALVSPLTLAATVNPVQKDKTAEYSYTLVNAKQDFSVEINAKLGEPVSIVPNQKSGKPLDGCDYYHKELIDGTPVLSSVSITPSANDKVNTKFVFIPIAEESGFVKTVVAFDYYITSKSTPTKINEVCSIQNSITKRYTYQQVLVLKIGNSLPIQVDKDEVVYIKVVRAN